MNARTLLRLLCSRQLPLLLSLDRLLRPIYRACFVATACEMGLLVRLARGPASMDEIAAGLAAGSRERQALEAWLRLGVRIGELRAGNDGYRLRGSWSRRLARPANDAAAALLQEAVRLQTRLIVDGPARARAQRLFTIAEYDPSVVARSSRLLEPFVAEAIDLAVPKRGAVRLLDVGCGSGAALEHAARRNPALTAIGLELDPTVARTAREHVRAADLASRVTIEAGDVRRREPRPEFDVVSLHNNVYYFPASERGAVLARLGEFLRPGGALIVTTACRGGSVAFELLNLWCAMTEGCSELPTADELERLLRAAGFASVRRKSLIPGDRFFAFVARR